ncbi:MAG: hypothetical protein PF569_00480 [Candidatus Woesearchaeota archaeon]|jgi:hypothetical protein|nr:hypothetical protein [Candidatus Woesearchaeota archaeon]
MKNEETVSNREPLPADIQIERCLQELIEGKAIKFKPGCFTKD